MYSPTSQAYPELGRLEFSGVTPEQQENLDHLPYEFVAQVSSDERRLALLREQANLYLKTIDEKVDR